MSLLRHEVDVPERHRGGLGPGLCARWYKLIDRPEHLRLPGFPAIGIILGNAYIIAKQTVKLWL